jgi:hypothetical protein
MNRKPILIALFLFFVFNAASAIAQTTGFTYQGKLTDNTGAPLSGNYDFQFKLFDLVSGGTQVSTTLTFDGMGMNLPFVVVTGGIFTVQLDFGACPTCFNGAARFLEIGIKPHGGGAFTMLSPRQPLTSTPYAIKTQNLTFNGPYDDGFGTPFTLTNTFTGEGAGLNTTPDPSLTSSIGKFNAFYGARAGQANTTGGANAFFGFHAGFSNTTGGANAFFGPVAGQSNTTGSANAFFGHQTGFSNTTGSANAFFGLQAGASNTTGLGNTFIGNGADFNASNPTGNFNTLLGISARVNSGVINGTAIGAQALVTQSNALVLGSINGINSATADTNVGIGTTAPSQRLHVVGDGLFTGNVTVSGTLNANVSGNIVNAATQFNIGGLRAFYISDSTATNTNTAVGVLAGAQNPTGKFNSFFGCGAGQSTTAGGNNSFFGCGAGGQNQTGNDNAFFGRNAGQLNVANENAFFGSFAGAANTGGTRNAFFGKDAGRSNTGDASTGNDNSFFGYRAGFANTGSANAFFGSQAGSSITTGGSNAFFGSGAGDTTIGSGNTFIGSNANESCSSCPTGDFNTLLGYNAHVFPGGLTNSTAIGAQALVTQSNSLVLGNGNVNVGIGTTAPANKLQIVDSSNTGLRVQTNTAGGTVASFGGKGAFQVDAPDTFGGRFYITEDGKVGIGLNFNQSPDKLAVNGSVSLLPVGGGGNSLCINGGNQISLCSSSIRYKTNIATLHTGLGLIDRLRPVTFDWKQGGAHDLGLVAEEVAKVEPLLVTHNEKGEIEGVKYDRVGVVLINVVKEQQAQLEEQRQQSRQQAEQIEAQRKEIAALKKLVCLNHPEAEMCKP